MRLAFAIFVVLTVPAVRADDIDSPMYHDPDIALPKVERRFPAGVAQQWIEMLGRPEADYQAQASLAIALAHERGLPGLADAAGPLQRLLEKEGTSPAVRAAAGRALVALDVRAAAPALLAYAKADAELRDVIEPA